MTDALPELTTGGILALLLVKVVLDAWTKWQEHARRSGKKSTPPPPGCALPLESVEQIGRIHSVVSRTDEVGTPLLYQLLRQQTEILARMEVDLREQKRASIAQTEALAAIHREISDPSRMNGAS